ncbi:sensor histidine kinase [Ilumatobacter sp.]|uniref:sensor histidine kinase n=1 Tax=Ilumatobacter sp. TaxID=1967498 RepID=UPI003AF9CE59
MWVAVAVAVAVAAGFALGRVTADRRRHGEARVPEATLTTTPPEPLVDEVLDALHFGVAISGRDGRHEFKNAAAREVARTHAGVLIDDAIRRHLARGLVGISSEEVVELHGPPAEVFIVRSVALPSGGSVSFVEDVSERRRTERMRTDFVANVSHELRTPIGALSVLAEALVDADDREVVHRIVDRMQGEAERASRTIDDLLELSEIESGSERDFGPVRLGEVVRDSVGRVAELSARREITISMLDPVDGGAPRAEGLVVLGDAGKLVSAVGNVVENAVKYSDPGDVVQVRVRRVDGWGEVVITDEGRGIPRQDLDRIFERFYRVDRARSRATGGTGLGLSIVRNIANMHGGSVSVDSTEGEGTTFVLRLPLVAGAAGAASDDEGAMPTRDEEIA